MDGVCSTLTVNPFEGPARAGEGPTERNEVPRLVRNQIAIRGAQVAGRALTAIGTTAMATGIAIRSEPVKTPRTFLHVDRRSRKDVLKHKHGKKWRAAMRAEKRKHVHYRRSTKVHGQIDVQERRAMKRALNPRKPLKATVLKGAGTVALSAGRLVPSLGVGYVISGYLDTSKPGVPTVKTGELVGDAKALDASIAADVMAGVTAVSYGVALGKALIGEIL